MNNMSCCLRCGNEEISYDKLGQFFYCKYCKARYNPIKRYWYWQTQEVTVKGVKHLYE